VPRAATHDRRAAALVGLAVAYALVAATTTPFSTQADLATALPIVVLAVAVVIRWPLSPGRGAERRARASARTHGAQHPFAWWVVLFAAIAGWELAQYLLPGSRALHPTLSSMADAVDRYYPLKAVVFFGWLWLGAAIVRDGRPHDPARGGIVAQGEDP
jgi:hypothetical protein